MSDLWVWVAPKLGQCLVFAVAYGIAWSWAGMIGERVVAERVDDSAARAVCIAALAAVGYEQREARSSARAPQGEKTNE